MQQNKKNVTMRKNCLNLGLSMKKCKFARSVKNGLETGLGRTNR